MNIESKSIYNFKKGDLITRVKSSKPGSKSYGDTSYIGTPFYFLGIANGCIYLEPFTSKDTLAFEQIMEQLLLGKNVNKQLNLELWDEGWALYIKPTFKSYNKGTNLDLALNSMFSEPNIDEENSNELISKLQKFYDKAIEREDYELAEKYKRKLEDLKNNKK